MKLFWFPLATLFLSSALAQHPDPLPVPGSKPQPVEARVGGHRVGETFEEWLAINQLDIADICRKHTRSESRTMDFKAVCRRLEDIGTPDAERSFWAMRPLNKHSVGSSWTDI